MSDPKKLQVKVKDGDAARHGTDKAVAILRPLLAMGPVRRCYAILLLALCTAFGPLCTDMYLPALPDIAKDLNISTAFAQASITACLLGLALGQLFMGPVSDGRGRRGPLIFSLALFTVSSGLCSVMQDGYSFLALRFCMGLGGAGGIVLARAICCDSYQGSALTRFMSLLMAIHSVGPILGPVIGGFVAGAAGWRAVFWLLAAVGVFLTVSCFFILPETLAPRDRVPGGVAASFKNAGRLFRQSAFLCYCGQQGFTMGGFFAYISSSPFIFQKIYGFSVEGFSFIFGINAIGITLFTLLAGLLSKRFSDRGILGLVRGSSRARLLCRSRCSLVPSPVAYSHARLHFRHAGPAGHHHDLQLHSRHQRSVSGRGRGIRHPRRGRLHLRLHHVASGGSGRTAQRHAPWHHRFRDRNFLPRALPCGQSPLRKLTRPRERESHARREIVLFPQKSRQRGNLRPHPKLPGQSPGAFFILGEPSADRTDRRGRSR